MKSYERLPDSYELFDTILIKDDKKPFTAVNIVAGVLFVILFVVGGLIVDPRQAFKLNSGSWLPFTVLALGYIAYVFLHKLTHALVLSALTKTKLRLEFFGRATYEGEMYYPKPCYLIAALAPLLIWGAVFGILNAFFRTGIWFWVFWLLQAENISGVASDLFVSCKLLTYPKEVLVQDAGGKISIYRYSAAKAEKTKENGGET